MLKNKRTGKKKIGIFGGTFNPIHIGHLRTAEEVREVLSLDEILFVPTFSPPFEKRFLAHFKHRLEMVRLAIKDNPSFFVSDIESQIPGKSYSAHTVEALAGEYGEKLFFIMGADAFIEFPKWYLPEKIVDAVDLVVVLRPPYNIDSLIKSPFVNDAQSEKLKSIEKRRKVTIRSTIGNKRMIFLRTTPLDVSATKIRTMIKKGKSINYLLPQRVESYIISSKLYS
jgi:nicotinate-nucleotide adenylyltransferase